LAVGEGGIVVQAVQQPLRDNAAGKKRRGMKTDPSPLTGKLFDEKGDPLTPSHAVKNGRRYRYYVSRRIINKKATGAEGWRISARELESAVQSFAIHLLTDHSQLAA